jgi:TonB-dependent starch-binding outer membrane protein SusC
MKKKHELWTELRPNIKKLIMKLKLVFIIIIAGITNVIATTTYSQEVKFSLDLHNKSLEQALDEIEKQSSFYFVFNQKKIDVNRIVDIRVNQGLITEVLPKLFYGTNVNFVILDKQILLTTDPIVKTSTAESYQQRSVTGIIVDAVTKEPLPGVTVLVEGTTVGTVTDMNGKYSLDIPRPDAVLLFSFIGYNTEKKQLNGESQIDISMVIDVQKLEEVVVVGYGTMKKKDLTGAVSSISFDRISETKKVNAYGALQGQIPGVDVYHTSNKPGDSYGVEIRGVNTINKSTSPLYIVDGMAVTGMDVVNPDDIESIDVLKDASSTAIYGSRGANGVVIITTKSGKEGKSKITYDAYVGFRQAYNLPRIMNTPEFAQFTRDAIVGLGSSLTLSDVFDANGLKNIENGKTTDWIGLLLKNGLVTNHNIGVSGGANGLNYSVALGYQHDDGSLDNEYFRRYSLRSNIDKKVNNFLKFGLNMLGNYTIKDAGSYEALRSAYRLRPTASAYDDDGNLVFWPDELESQVSNPLFDVMNETRETKAVNLLGNIYLQISPLKWMSFTTCISPDVYFQRYGEYHGQYTKASAGNASSTKALYNSSNYFKYTWDNTLKLTHKIGEHAIDATFVSSIWKYKEDGVNTQKTGYSTDDYLFYNIGAGSTVNTLSSYYKQQSLASVLGRINYSYKDKYLLTINGRYDGSSKLAEGNKWKFFPSAAVAWRLSEEAFIKKVDLLSNLKLRLSYGISGNNVVDAYSSQASTSVTTYSWGATNAKGIDVSSLANHNLSWEITKEVDLGIDLGLWNNRVSGTIDLYHRLSEDVIMTRNLPIVGGFSSVSDNVGSVLNRGIEISLQTVNIKSKDFTWTTGFAFSKNHNEIKDIYGDKTNDTGNSWFIGQPVNVYYNYKANGIWKTEEADQAAVYGQTPGQVRVVDKNNDGVINSDDKMILGSPTPKWNGSFSNNLKYKNLDFGFSLFTRQGVTMYSYFHEKFAWDQDSRPARFNGLKLNYWTPENNNGTWYEPGNSGNYRTALYFKNTSFVKVSYINLGYSFGKGTLDKLKMSRFRVYASAENPFTFTKYDGWDPEIANGDTYGYSVMCRKFLFGVNVEF